MQSHRPSTTFGTCSWVITAAVLTVFGPTSSGRAEEAAAVEMAYPMRQLSNGVLDMKVYTPDTEAGFYRGTRFDWSGIIAGVEYGGHRYYGPWRSPHQPTGNDFVSGPAEEFAMADPMGYDEAGPGDSFVKVGVGLLERIDEKDYHFFGQYRILRPGEWTVDSGPDWVEFRQALEGERGWAYRYTKRISLGEGAPTFAIYHRLENAGSKAIDIDHYNHNFTLIDDVPFGPDYSVTFPFSADEPRAPCRSMRCEETTEGLAWFRENRIDVLKPLGDASLWLKLRGPGGVEHNACTIRNDKTGAEVSFAGDVPIREFRFWSVEAAACPEPFISLQLAPGEAKEWTWQYVLSVDTSPEAGD